MLRCEGMGQDCDEPLKTERNLMDKFNPRFLMLLAFFGILGYLLGDAHGCLVALCIFLGVFIVIDLLP